ncbi:MAG: arylesterase [Candidatus Binatia bacterium]
MSARRCPGPVLLAVLLLLPACRSTEPARPPATAPSTNAPVILFVGDSITHGQGLTRDQAFPALLQRRILEAGYDYRCVNVGVSGLTTDGGLGRLGEFQAKNPAVVVVELGANDFFRGVPVERWRDNLAAMVKRFQAGGARVLVTGTIFPLAGRDLESAADAYRAVSEATGAKLLPDIMNGVVGTESLTLEDHIHPNAEGHVKLAEKIWPQLMALL